MKKWGGQLDIRPPHSKNWGGRVPPIPPRIDAPVIGYLIHSIAPPTTAILKKLGVVSTSGIAQVMK